MPYGRTPPLVTALLKATTIKQKTPDQSHASLHRIAQDEIFRTENRNLGVTAGSLLQQSLILLQNIEGNREHLLPQTTETAQQKRRSVPKTNQPCPQRVQRQKQSRIQERCPQPQSRLQGTISGQRRVSQMLENQRRGKSKNAAVCKGKRKRSPSRQQRRRTRRRGSHIRHQLIRQHAQLQQLDGGRGQSKRRRRRKQRKR